MYPKNTTDFSTNGIMTLQPISCVVSEEINGDYSLKIVMPEGDATIQPEMIIKAPTPKGSQLFRVYMPDVDVFGNNTYYARHIFYDLLDDFIEDKRPEGNGAVAITSILSGTDFTGYSDISRTSIAIYQMISPVNALLSADNSFISRWGGEIERDNFAVRMLQRVGQDRNVSIRYRKNLIGMTVKTDLSNVVTRIYPTGRQADGQTLLTLPEKYVDSPLIGNYSKPKIQRFDYPEIQIINEITEDNPEIITEEDALELLREAAQKEYEENNVDQPEISAEVEFIPLEKTDEYKHLAALEQVYIGDTVHVYHEPLGINFALRVASYEYNSILQRYNQITLGVVIPSVGSKGSTLDQAVNSAMDAVKQASIRINGAEIAIAGKVSFSDLSGSGKTTINGDNITTGRIESNNGEFWLDLEEGTFYLSGGTYAGNLEWDNGASIIGTVGTALTIASGGGVRIQLMNNIVTISDDTIISGGVTVGGTLEIDGGLTVDGDSPYSGRVRIQRDEGEFRDLLFKDGILVDNDA